MSEQKQNQEFDPKVWEADCRKYDINHEKLGFDVDITFPDGKVKMKLNHLDEKYQKAVKHLMLKNMNGAVYYLNEMFHPWYAVEEDQEAEEKHNMEHLHANLEYFIRTLFLSGLDAFCEAVSQQTAYLNARYELTHTRFEDGTLIRSDGSRWNESGWEKDGTTTHSFLTEALWGSLLELRKSA